jgi:hypothetical protein
MDLAVIICPDGAIMSVIMLQQVNELKNLGEGLAR